MRNGSMHFHDIKHVHLTLGAEGWSLKIDCDDNDVELYLYGASDKQPLVTIDECVAIEKDTEQVAS